MASMQAQLLQFGQLQGALQELKDDVVQMLSQAEERRLQEAREAERVRAIERDNVAKALNELRRDLQKLPRLQEESDLRKAEQRRLSDSFLGIQQEVNTLGQEVESKVRGIPFLEDGRQQDAKRIARLQQESLEAMKRIEQLVPRLQVTEDTLQRQERDTGELKDVLAQMRTSQREFTEGQLLETDHMKRHMAEWVERLEASEQRMDRFSGRMQEFTEDFRADRGVVENVERFQEQIRRDQAQTAELQRLGEERQKRQLEQWQDENEKRWRKELLRWDHQRNEQGQRNQQIADQFRSQESRLGQHRAELDWIAKLFQAQATYQSQESRRWQGEMNKLLEDRPKKE
jgi:hypothetical protein